MLKKPEIEENSEELENKDEFYYLFKCFNLFNLCQTEGIEFEPFVTENLENHPVESADEVIEEYKDRPKIINDSIESAFYVRSTDEIHIPKITGFKSSESYYGALFHELAHSTGHSSRLNRKLGNSFGSDPYAKEELIAETTSTMICASIGLTSELSNSASYLKSWLRNTKEKRKAITLYSAFAQAEKAKNYILSGKRE